jgi:hypothetical protein
MLVSVDCACAAVRTLGGRGIIATDVRNES